MLKQGDKIPFFELADQDGNLRRGEEFLGKGNWVIFFYPMDFTPGCIKEVCSFRDNYEKFSEKGATVIGISADSTSTHQKFSSKYKLPFPLLTDKGNKVRKQFGFKKLLGFMPATVARVTFIIDSNGYVLHIFDSLFGYKDHVAEALKFIGWEDGYTEL